MNKLSAIAIAFTTVAIAAASAPTADAGTISVVRRGTSCQHGYAEGQVSYFEDGALYNDSTTWWRTALCPTSVDIESTSGYGYGQWRVQVYDRHYTQDVSCRGISLWYHGGTSWGAAASSVGSSPSFQTLNVSVSVGDTLHCYLPAVYQGNRSGLVSYSNTITPS
jgi:hypothetical protein